MTESQSELAKLYSKQQSKPRYALSLKMMFTAHKPTKVRRGPPKSITIIQTVEPSTVKPKFVGTMGDFAEVEVIPDTEKYKKNGGVMNWLKHHKKERNLPAEDESVENTVIITINSTETAGAVKSTVEEFNGSQVVESSSYTASADNATSRRHAQDRISLMRGLLTCCQIEITDVVLPNSAAANVDVPEEENSLVDDANNEESKEEQGVEVDIIEVSQSSTTFAAIGSCTVF